MRAFRAQIADMFETMYDAHGIGLAATQVDFTSGSSSSTFRKSATSRWC